MMFELCDKDAPSSELFLKLINIINSRSTINKPNTRNSNNQSKIVFSPYLPNDDLAKVNKLFEEMEKRSHSQLETGIEGSKTNNNSASSQCQSQEFGNPKQYIPTFEEALKIEVPGNPSISQRN
ncbi:hypothetical protein AVEN_137519-1 [Araneus ventricosus]|uniref:Uncharacterized protein n=1 Tax=Araneus ventricosus TaxID=182803 RepID=A0A4Y2QG20_ARAVE|nr:hypothetical protein AVEN_137519-1 [Araneus ventricosus]